MTGFIEDTWLRMNGATEEEIATVNALTPKAQVLVAFIKQHEKDITDILHVAIPLLTKIIAKQRELHASWPW